MNLVAIICFGVKVRRHVINIAVLSYESDFDRVSSIIDVVFISYFSHSV